jgi:lipoyl(octanoyl) transferase
MSAVSLTACALGPTSYRAGLELQEALVRARAAGETGDWLLFPDHPPVLTVGRNPSPGSVRSDSAALARLGIEVFEVARGGDVTWHGPGQLVGYPICDLDRRGRDLHRFLRDLEQSLIDALARCGLAADRVPGRTGVWVGARNGAGGGAAMEKIASIGIAVRRWVSYHGFALNVAPDLGFFDLIHPCGLRDIHMTSVKARLADDAPDLERMRRIVAEELARQLGYETLQWVKPDAAWSVAGQAGTGRDALETGTHHAA